MDYIESLLRNANIEYKSRGSDYIVHCLNPEHDDGSPSMHIDRAEGLFNCFSCGFKGDINKLHNLLNIEVPADTLLLEVKIAQATKLMDKLFVYDVDLKIPDNAMPYLAPWRNISSKTFEDHKCFFTEDSPYDRICIPIRDTSNKLRFIEARAVKDTQEEKYLRIPKNSTIDFLYNINCGAPSIVLVEGIFDYLNLYELGIRNVVPIFGLYNFNYYSLKQLSLYNIISVIIMTDNDDAGNKAANDISKILKKGGVMYKRVLPITDPGDLTKKELYSILSKNDCRVKNGFII